MCDHARFVSNPRSPPLPLLPRRLFSCLSRDTQPGCTIQPVYGLPTDHKFVPLYCAGHKKEGMVSQKRLCCLATRCYRRPSFGMPGDKGKYCAEHKVPPAFFFFFCSAWLWGNVCSLLFLLMFACAFTAAASAAAEGLNVR